MCKGLKVFAAGVFLVLGAAASASASLSKYTYPYDISWIEWQLLNLTAAWRGTTTPADPFILERMEFDRKKAKIYLSVRGSQDDTGEENLKKSVENITAAFKQKFPDFQPQTDLVIHYRFEADDGVGSVAYMEYRAGSFY